MEVKHSLGIFTIFLLCLCSRVESEGYLERLKKTHLEPYNAMQLIRKSGYPAEAHTILSNDGYLLELHRIPPRKACSLFERKKPPVLILHGLFASSDFFLVNGPNNSLPYLLSDLGYDVWLPNIRGNIYSRAHVTLNPAEYKFWDYTWHECAVYDLPAIIDFVNGYTDSEKLIYIGYSMGSTMFFVLMSEKPEYNNKIELGLMMAPVAYLAHQRSPLFKVYSYMFSPLYLKISKLLGSGSFVPEDRLFRVIARHVCEVSEIPNKICHVLLLLGSGINPDNYKENVMDTIIDHYTGGFPVKLVNHYAQLVKSGEFAQYNYSTLENMLRYGSPQPPKYKVKNIKAPMNFYVGKNDYLGDIQDAKRLAREAPGFREAFEIKNPNFSHIDFLFSKNLKNELLDKMISDIEQVTNKGLFF